MHIRIVHLKWPGPFPLQSTIRRVCHRVRRNHLARRNSTQNWTLLKASDWFLSKRIFANLCHPLPYLFWHANPPNVHLKKCPVANVLHITAFLGLSSILVIKSDTSRRSCHLTRNSLYTWPLMGRLMGFRLFLQSRQFLCCWLPSWKTNQKKTRTNRHRDVSGIFQRQQMGTLSWDVKTREFSCGILSLVVSSTTSLIESTWIYKNLKSTQMSLQPLRFHFQICKNSVARLSSFMGINEGAHNTSQHLTRKFHLEGENWVVWKHKDISKVWPIEGYKYHKKSSKNHPKNQLEILKTNLQKK